MSFFAHFEIWYSSRFVFSKNKKLLIFDTFLTQISLVFYTAEIAFFPYLFYSTFTANFQAKKAKICFFEINRFFWPQTTQNFEDLFRFHFWAILVISHFRRLMAIFSLILISSQNWDEFVPVSHYEALTDLVGGNVSRIDLRADIVPIGKLLTLHAIANTITARAKSRKSRKWVRPLDIHAWSQISLISRHSDPDMCTFSLIFAAFSVSLEL